MNELLASITWILIGAAVVAAFQRNMPRLDGRFVWASFGAHVASAFILVWLTYNVLGGGDMQVYYHYGEVYGEYIRNDPSRWAPELLNVLLQLDADVPVEPYSGQGSSTASIIAMTTFVMLVTGTTKYGTAIVFALLALSGKIAMYFAFRNHFPAAYRSRFLVAILLVPSAVFWTSGVVKESMAIAGMGWMIWGLHTLIVRRRRIRTAPWLIMGGVMVAISKAYVLFPMAAAAGIWWFWHRSLVKTGTVAVARKPAYMIGAVVVAIVGVLGVGELFPEYSIEQLGEEAAELQETGQRVEGGSNYQIGDPAATTLTGQLAFAPVAILTAMFRPLIIEAHNAVAVINGLEMLAIKALWWWTLAKRGLRGSWRLIRSSPALMFCVVFVLLFSLGVGLATTNLGTLSRYRVPMMPLYLLVLMMALPKNDRR